MLSRSMAPVLRDQHKDALYAVIAENVEAFLTHKSCIIVEQRTGFAADARDVMFVGAPDECLDGRQILRAAEPDHQDASGVSATPVFTSSSPRRKAAAMSSCV